MPRFEYEGFDASGARVKGALEAPGRRVALETLRGRQVFATEMQELAALNRRSFRWQRRRVGPLELAAATRQMATLLEAGLPLDEVLASVAEQTNRALLSRSLNRAREELVQGGSLHQALEAQPRIFSSLFINMVKVGESSGTLDQVLAQLSDLLENQARTRSRIQAALTYPALMGLVGSAVLLLLFAFVVPQITRMLDNLNMELPLMTRLLIRAGELFSGGWWLLLLAVLLGAAVLRRYGRSERGALELHRRVLQLPLIGRLILFTATARLSRTLATLLGSGVPLLTALDISRGLMGNRVLRQALENTAVCVREGEGLAAPLQRSGVFPPLLIQMAAAGEKSGQLENMLGRAARSYENQVDSTIAALLPLLEPLMILLMGSVVGAVVLAVLLPIFQASQGMG